MPNQHKHVCAEVSYTNSAGDSVHSDICGDINDPEWHYFLRQCLDEWIRKSNGTGEFRVGQRQEALDETDSGK